MTDPQPDVKLTLEERILLLEIRDRGGEIATHSSSWAHYVTARSLSDKGLLAWTSTSATSGGDGSKVCVHYKLTVSGEEVARVTGAS